MRDCKSFELQKQSGVAGSDNQPPAEVPTSQQPAADEHTVIAPECGTRAGGARRGAGRKRINIDLNELEKLYSLDCTEEEIADFFGITPRTLERRRRREPEFERAMRRGRASVRIRIRRAQMKHLEAGNVPMAIHLGKTLLGQHSVTELSGPQGQPIQLSLEAFDAVLKEARKDESSS